ncbi:MAG: hypothetical protein GY938_32090 [Ketobacter sp.]|nr:hypothetical protein [Ketobacter sp.]
MVQENAALTGQVQSLTVEIESCSAQLQQAQQGQANVSDLENQIQVLVGQLEQSQQEMASL